MDSLSPVCRECCAEGSPQPSPFRPTGMSPTSLANTGSPSCTPIAASGGLWEMPVVATNLMLVTAWMFKICDMCEWYWLGLDDDRMLRSLFLCAQLVTFIVEQRSIREEEGQAARATAGSLVGELSIGMV
eukprot:gene31527-38104_t